MAAPASAAPSALPQGEGTFYDTVQREANAPGLKYSTFATTDTSIPVHRAPFTSGREGGRCTQIEKLAICKLRCNVRWAFPTFPLPRKRVERALVDEVREVHHRGGANERLVSLVLRFGTLVHDE